MAPNDIVLKVRNLESQILNHSKVEDVTVLREEKQDGEIAFKIFVEPADYNESTIDEIKDFCHNLSSSQPVEILFREIPRTPTGKVNRQQLLESETGTS